MSGKKTDIIMLAAAILYAVSVSCLSLLRYYNFTLFIGDHATISQALWSTLHGNFMQTTTGSHFYNSAGGVNFLAFHQSPIYLLILPLFYVIPPAAGLIVLKCILMAAASILLYKISKEAVGHVESLFISMLFLISPNILCCLDDSFHADYFAPLILFATLYSLIKGRFWLYVIFTILFLSIKESYAPTLFAVGIYALLKKYPKKWVIWPVLASFVWTMTLIAFMKLVLYRETAPLDSNNWGALLVNNITSLNFIKQALIRENILKDLWFFISSARVLTFLDLSCIIWMPDMLVRKALNLSYGGHYGLLITSAIFFSFPFAIRKIEVFLSKKNFNVNIIIAAIFIFAFLTSFESLRILSPKNFMANKYKETQLKALAMIPKDASVSCNDLYLARLAQRDRLDWLGHEDYKRKYDYVLIDLNRFNNESIEWPMVSGYWKDFLESGKEYRCIFNENNIRIYRKNA